MLRAADERQEVRAWVSRPRAREPLPVGVGHSLAVNDDPVVEDWTEPSAEAQRHRPVGCVVLGRVDRDRPDVDEPVSGRTDKLQAVVVAVVGSRRIGGPAERQDDLRARLIRRIDPGRARDRKRRKRRIGGPVKRRDDRRSPLDARD